MKNDRLYPDAKTTVEYIPPSKRINWFRPGLLIFGATFLITAISFNVGFTTCRYYYPRQIEVEKIVFLPAASEKVKEKPAAALSKRDLSEETDRLANEKVKVILQSFVGMLEIKDNEAQTVRYKKAAIASKGGFTDIKKGMPYTIHSYFLHNNTGYGIVGDNQTNFFMLTWHAGSIKAPALNPGTIMVSSGKRIEIGISK